MEPVPGPDYTWSGGCFPRGDPPSTGLIAVTAIAASSGIKYLLDTLSCTP